MQEYLPEGFTKKTKKQEITLSILSDAQKSGEILYGICTLCDTEHNLLVDLNGIKGIIPRKSGALGIESGETRDIALISRVAKEVCFTVSEITFDESGEPTAILSRLNAQKKFKDYFFENYSVGDIIDAKITHLTSFGAFCDIGCGIIALLPIDSVSVSRISHPKDRFCVGDEIKVVIKGIDENGKITVSHKELLGSWEENAELFSQGQTVTGVVRSVEDYGIFVELTPNLAGLAEPKENVKIGQTASVYIKSIIKEKMKVKLIVIDSFDGNYYPSERYFYKGNHIDKFVYSPETAEKTVTTEFA